MEVELLADRSTGAEHGEFIATLAHWLRKDLPAWNYGSVFLSVRIIVHSTASPGSSPFRFIKTDEHRYFDVLLNATDAPRWDCGRDFARWILLMISSVISRYPIPRFENESFLAEMGQCIERFTEVYHHAIGLSHPPSL
jgi:hypothetical protein